VADNIVGRYKRPLLDIMKDVIVGPVLYHEVGHHLHETVGSAARGDEVSADDWSSRLMEVHFRRCYRRLNRFISVLDTLTAPVLRIVSRRFRDRANHRARRRPADLR
jgi:hypothetical protein